MEENKTVLTKERLRAIARYETDFNEYPEIVACIPAADNASGVFSAEDPYAMTAADLLEAFRNVAKKDPTVYEFLMKWFFPVGLLRKSFGLEDALKNCSKYDLNEQAKDDDEVRGLPVTEDDILMDVWDAAGTLADEGNWDVRISETDGVGHLREALAMFLLGRKKPVWERDFADWQKRDYVETFESDIRVMRASAREILLARRFADELAPKGDTVALHFKGYACYGGNRVYPCDWNASKDCMTALYEKTDDPQYANTLGYIYYYGRCNGGVPEYEKAFRAFSVSAANGLHEGMYKLADMYRGGYWVKKSERAARTLYEAVYDDCLRQFPTGRGNSFADAALRMGRVYMEGLGGDRDPSAAYAMCLQAVYAARLRAEQSSFFGDAKAVANAEKALEETKADLPDDYFAEFIGSNALWTLDRLTEKNCRCSVKVDRHADGTADITVKRLPLRRNEQPEPVLITASELNYCRLVTEITVMAMACTTSLGEEPVTVDYGDWDAENKRTALYFNGEEAGWIDCAEYRFYGDEKDKETEG